MDVYIQASIGMCDNFMSETDGNKGEVSVVISPVRIISPEGSEKLQISNGCNLWRSCHNTDCYFSLASIEKSQAQAVS